MTEFSWSNIYWMLDMWQLPFFAFTFLPHLLLTTNQWSRYYYLRFSSIEWRRTEVLQWSGWPQIQLYCKVRVWIWTIWLLNSNLGPLCYVELYTYICFHWKKCTLCFVRNECFARYDIFRVLMIQLVSNTSIYYRVNPLWDLLGDY